MAAFEGISLKQAWYGNTALNKYIAVQFDGDGKFEPADGTGVFAGIVQYPSEAASQMATVVTAGWFPGLSADDITAGALLAIDGDNPGMFKEAGENDTVVGVAVTGASAGDLFTVAIK